MDSSAPADDRDYADELREQFGHLATELAKIDVRQPGMRLVNTSRRIALLRRIDNCLDDYQAYIEMVGVSAHIDPASS